MSEKIPESTSPEREPSQLTWKDIDFIVANKIGLRSVSDNEQAETEMSSGTEYGDALALYNIDTLPPEEIEAKKDTYARFNKQLPLPKNTGTIRWYESAIKNFIQKSLDSFDTREKPMTFFLMHVDAHRAYDTEMYEGLGKAGTQAFMPDSYLAHFEVDSDVSPLSMAESAFSLFIKKLRDLQNQ